MSGAAHPGSRAGSAVALVVLVATGPGCEWQLTGEPGRVCASSDYPRCGSNLTLLDCRLGPSPESRRCAPGTVCLDGVNDRGQHWALCLPAGSVRCDPQAHVARCDGAEILRCELPGYASPVTCPDEGPCVEGLSGAICAQPGSTACDPTADGERCEGGRPARCDPDHGVWRFEAACAAPEVCRVNDRGASCADPAAAPCDAQDFIARCDGNAVIDCGRDSGFTERHPCAADERCRASTRDARCFGPEHPDCEPALFSERCEADARIYCSSYGVEELWGCLGDEVCRSNTSGAFCVAADAEACELASFVRRCDAGQLVSCTSSGYTRQSSCAGDAVCLTTPVGAGCAPPGTEICDPANFVDRCDEQELVSCSSAGLVQRQTCLEPEVCRVSPWAAICTASTGPLCEEPFAYLRCEGGAAVYCDWYGFERAEACSDGSHCVEGDLGYLGWTVKAWCVEQSASSCAGSTPVACDGSVASLCFGGQLIEEDCGSGVCVADGTRWVCALEDAPACDSATELPRCEDADRLRICFGSPGVELIQTCSSGCTDEGGGARCGP